MPNQWYFVFIQCNRLGKFEEAVRAIKRIHAPFQAKITPNGYVILKYISTLPIMRRIMTNLELPKQLAGFAFPDLDASQSKSGSEQAAQFVSKISSSSGQRFEVVQLWTHWAYVFDFLPMATAADKAVLMSHIDGFGKLFVGIFGKLYVTPYIHIVCSHTGPLIDKFGNLGQFEQQGVERTVGIHKLSALRATANGGGRGAPEERPWMFPKQIMLRFLRIIYYANKFDPDMLKPVDQRKSKAAYVYRNRKRSLELESNAAAVGSPSLYKKAKLATSDLQAPPQAPPSTSIVSDETLESDGEEDDVEPHYPCDEEDPDEEI
jgi:hypothetical protein